jgi:hypothetical protein
MAVIDLSADVPPLTVERVANGSIELRRNGVLLHITEDEFTDLIRIVRPAQTPAKLQRYRMA